MAVDAEIEGDQLGVGGGDDGRSPRLGSAFESAVASTHSPIQRRRLARRLSLAVADAHRRGEVHGSLSPAVVRFDGSAIDLVPVPSAAGATDRLRYASPEVARGDDPTAASDVFSLALLVREIFEGAPVRPGTLEEVAPAAVDGHVDAPGDLPATLRALALESTALDPAQRPTATDWVRACAVDPRRVISPWWLVGLAALVVAALLMGLRSSADARERADERYVVARDALQGLLKTVGETLERVEDPAPVAAAGESALEALRASFALKKNVGAEERQLLARASLWTAIAQRTAGDDERAKVHAAAALDAAAQLDDVALRDRITCRAETILGQIMRRTGLPRESAAHFKNGIAAGQARMAAADTTREDRLAVAELNLRAPVGAQETLVYLIRARKALSGDEIEPDDVEALELLAEIDRIEANLQYALGQRPRAISTLESHVETAERLVEIDPGILEYREILGSGAEVLAKIQRETGRHAAAVESLRTSVGAWSLVRELDPKSTDRTRAWAQATRRLSEALATVGEWEESYALHRESLAEMERLLAAGELSEADQMQLTMQLVAAAETMIGAGDTDSASRSLSRCVELLRETPPKQRGQWRWSWTLARALVVEAEILLARGGGGNWDDAAERAYVFVEAVQGDRIAGERSKKRDRPTGALGVLVDAVRAGDVRFDPSRIRHELAGALLVGAAIRVIEGEIEAANDARTRALAIAEELVEQDAKDVRALALKARACFLLGSDREAADALAALDATGYRDVRLAAVRSAAINANR